MSNDIERMAERALRLVDEIVANELHVPTSEPLIRAQLEVDFYRLVRQGCWDRMQEANTDIWNATPLRFQQLSDAYANGAP